MMTSRLKLFRNAILSTIFIFSLIGLFNSITAFRIFDVFDPLADVFGGFEYTDMVYSKFLTEQPLDKRITLINVGDLSRSNVADLLNIVNSHKPAIVGFDIFYYFPKSDTAADKKLAKALTNTKNLVMASRLVINPVTDVCDSIISSDKMFTQNSSEGFVTLITNAKDQDDLKECRSFWPTMLVNEITHFAWSVKIAHLYDSAKVEKFLKHHKKEELVNFRGNIQYNSQHKHTKAYRAIDHHELLMPNLKLTTSKIKLFFFVTWVIP